MGGTAVREAFGESRLGDMTLDLTDEERDAMVRLLAEPSTLSAFRWPRGSIP